MATGQIIRLRDESIGLDGVLAIDSTVLGPAFGGIRRAAYTHIDDATRDARALASAMTAKCAIHELPAGGAKTALREVATMDVPAVYHAVGTAVEALSGRYVCGPDLGTGDAELEHVRGATRWVNPQGNDAGASTARGVLAAIRGLSSHLWGTTDVSGRLFAVQGLGSVGMAVAIALQRAGAIVVAADTNTERSVEAASHGIALVGPDSLLTQAIDVLVPCAVGGIVSSDNASSLRCAAICGSANNQLADDDAAQALQDHGIVHIPDFLANAGAVIEGVYTMRDGATHDVRLRAAQHIDATQQRVANVLSATRSDDVPPTVAAMRRVEAILDYAAAEP